LRSGSRETAVSPELSDDEGSTMHQNLELRRRLDQEHDGYRRKLQSYQDEQHRQAQLVQKLQAKVDDDAVSSLCYDAVVARMYFDRSACRTVLPLTVRLVLDLPTQEG